MVQQECLHPLIVVMDVYGVSWMCKSVLQLALLPVVLLSKHAGKELVGITKPVEMDVIFDEDVILHN